MKELTKIIEEPIPFMPHIAAIRNSPADLAHLSSINSDKKLARIQSLHGVSIGRLIDPNCDYFMFRHIFKFLIKTWQNLPDNLSETNRALHELEYPYRNI